MPNTVQAVAALAKVAMHDEPPDDESPHMEVIMEVAWFIDACALGSPANIDESEAWQVLDVSVAILVAHALEPHTVSRHCDILYAWLSELQTASREAHAVCASIMAVMQLVSMLHNAEISDMPSSSAQALAMDWKAWPQASAPQTVFIMPAGSLPMSLPKVSKSKPSHDSNIENIAAIHAADG
mmetsp:Transcript_46064/g.120673  ORF Transcript_46064/g.120673 Transcript_46064/m.120673 type:complete len:183 (+) Transcript_46064:1312-1860(+)